MEAEVNRRRGYASTSQGAPAQPRPAAAGVVNGNARASRSRHTVEDSDIEDTVHSALSSISGEDDGSEQLADSPAATHGDPSEAVGATVRALAMCWRALATGLPTSEILYAS